MGDVASRPAVSICIPTYNGALWVSEAIESALAQKHADLEVVVCDDASVDETVSLARQFGDERVRVVTNSERVGMARNWNRCIRESRGAYIKPLMQDDKLEPDCIGRMLDVIQESQGIGLVFCPRHLEFDDPGDPASILFSERFGELHRRLGRIARVNDGRALFEAMRRDRFRNNMLGEPTAVMVTREALVRIGLFNVQLHQLTDLEMWLRIAFFFRIGFVAEPLATFRVHERSASASNMRTGSAWLDRVWLMEGLRMYPEIRRRLLSRAGVRVWLLTYANAAKRIVTDGPGPARSHLRELGLYLGFRVRRRKGDVLHERLVD